MLYLLRNKIIFIFCFLGLSAGLFGQGNTSYNYYGFKKKNHYFGLTLGFNQSGYKIQHSNQFILNDSIKINESISVPGLTLSMITNFKIGEHFDFRILPSIVLAYRKIEYVPKPNSEAPRIRTIESVLGEIPLLIRFTSQPYKDRRMFVLAGVKYGYDFSSNSRADKNKFEVVRISPHDFSVEFGVGMQFYMPYFIFSPELKFSHGINNLLIYDGKLLESTIIEKLFSKALTISLHFEG